MQKSLAQIKATEGRDITSQVDNNTLVYGETGSGTGGAFNFMMPVNNALENLTELKIDNTKTDCNDCIPSNWNKVAFFVMVGGEHRPSTVESYHVSNIRCERMAISGAFSGYEQTLTTNENRTYKRYFNGNTWSEWQELATKSDLNDYVSKDKLLWGEVKSFTFSGPDDAVLFVIVTPFGPNAMYLGRSNHSVGQQGIKMYKVCGEDFAYSLNDATNTVTFDNIDTIIQIIHLS